MLHFLFPLGLFALSALVVPFAIHLLSRKPGRTIKVGSLKFLETSESRQLRSLKLTDFALLLIRLVLIALLALLLAKPFWQSSTPQAKAPTRGWVLIAPELLNQPHDPQFDQLLDSLVAAGNELHILTPDFVAAPMVSGKMNYPEAINTNAPTNYWSLLREIDQRLPTGMPLWIFTPDRLAFFSGTRPTLKRTAHWFPVPVPRENRWIQQVHALGNDSMQLVIGFSDSRQTKFAYYDLRFPKQQLALSGSGMPALEINPQSKQLRLLEKDNDTDDNLFTLPDLADSTTVTIWHDKSHEDDARYVRLALETVIELDRLPIIVKTQFITKINATMPHSGWAFWLAEQPPPQILLQQIASGLRLISDAGTQEYESVETSITIKTQQTEQHVNLSRRVAATLQGFALWTDGFGEPILEATPHGQGWHYRFDSRFNPLWNELVLSAAFPECLHDLLSQHSKINRISDQRRVSAGQSQPKTTIAATTISTTRATSWHFPFLILAVILFVGERWMVAMTRRS